MTRYERQIIDATGCSKEEAPGVEAYMRLERGALDAIGAGDFSRLAAECLEDVRSDPALASRLADTY